MHLRLVLDSPLICLIIYLLDIDLSDTDLDLLETDNDSFPVNLFWSPRRLEGGLRTSLEDILWACQEDVLETY